MNRILKKGGSRARRALAALAVATAILSPSNGQTAAGTGAQRTLTLKEVIDLALSKGPDIKIVQGGLDLARAQHEVNLAKEGISLGIAAGSGSSSGYQATYRFAADSADIRTVFGQNAVDGLAQSLQGSLSLTRGNQSSSNPATRIGLSVSHGIPPATSPSSTIGISATQTLWDGYPGGQTRAAVEKSKLTLGGKELTAQTGRSTAVSKVEQAYFALLTAQRTLAVRLSVLEKQNALLRQMSAVYELKQASSIDLATARINAKSAELDVRSGERDRSLARQRLANILGLADYEGLSVAEVEDPPLPASSLEEAVSIAKTSRADAAQIALSRRSADIDLALALGASQPSVSLSGGFDLGISWAGTAKNAESLNLGLRFSMPLLDAGAAASQVAATKAQIGMYDIQLSQLEATIATDVRDNYENVRLQADKIELARQNRDLFVAKLEIAGKQYEGGAISNQDLLSASVDAANAESSYAAARSAYLLAVSQLRGAMGL